MRAARERRASRRVIDLGALVLLLILWALPTVPGAAAQDYRAQQTGKIPRIGYLVPGPPGCRSVGGQWSGIKDAFLDGLKQSGFVPGQNVRWQPQCFQRELMPDVVTELVRQNPDVIVVDSTQPALTVKRSTKTIPIVFAGVADPVAVGLVSNLARPDGNITGFTNLHRELSQKKLQLLREIVPGLRRVGVLLDPAIEYVAITWRETEQAAHAMGISLVRLEARSEDEIEMLFPRMGPSAVQALLEIPGPLLWLERERIARLALQYQLPSLGQIGCARVGCLLEYAPSYPEMYRNVGKYVARILNGAKPADLPVQQPTKFELVINIKTARALGLTMPRSLLLQADQVIE